MDSKERSEKRYEEEELARKKREEEKREEEQRIRDTENATMLAAMMASII